MYLTYEEAVKRTQTDIERIRSTFPLFQTVAGILQKNDGRCYNKNIGEAIKNATDGKVFCYVDQFGYIDCHVCLGSYSDVVRFFYIKKADLKDGKRLDWSVLLKMLKQNLTRYYNEAEALENALETIRNTLNHYNELIEEENAIVRKLPARMSDYFNIRYRH